MKTLTRPLAIIGVLALMIGVSAWQVHNPSSSSGSVTGGTCTNQAVTAIDTSGVPTCTTVGTAMIGTLASGSNGLAASATTDATNASNIGTGTLAAARLPSGTARNLYTETSTSGTTSTTVSGTDTAMFTGYSMPGSTLTAGHRLHIRACWKHSTGTTSTTYKISIGGVVATAMPAGTGVPAVCADFDFAAVDGTHQQLLEYATAGLASTLSAAQQNAFTATLSGTVVINVVANAASNADVNTAYLLTVDLI